MQFLKALFKKKEDYSNEIAEVLSDKKVIQSQLSEPDKDDPEKVAASVEKRIKLLTDESLHPIARLKAAVTDYDDLISDYVKKLKSGNHEALYEIQDTRAKVGNVLHDELKMLKAELSFAEQALGKKEEFASGEGVKWAELQTTALEDLNIARARIEIIIPRDKKDMSEWKSYYRARISILENNAINIAARLLFTSHKTKNAIIEQYLKLLNKLLMKEGIEKLFHHLETRMESMVASESRRIRLQYPQFFAVPEEVANIAKIEEREIFQPIEVTKSLLDY